MSEDKKSKKNNKRALDNSSDSEDDKRKRVKWAGPLHELFLKAVQKLGDKAVPSAILTEMNVEGLTRENVASHLQKYRVQTREKLLSEYLKNSGAMPAMDDHYRELPPSYNPPPPHDMYARRHSMDNDYPYRGPITSVSPHPHHMPGNSPVPLTSIPPHPHSHPHHLPPHPNHPSYRPPPYHGAYSHPNYGYGPVGGRSASFSYHPRDHPSSHHHHAPPPGDAFADFDSPPMWRTAPIPPPPQQQQSPVPRSGSFSEISLPPRSASFSEPGRRSSFTEIPHISSPHMHPHQQQPPQFVEPPRRASFSCEHPAQRRSFSHEVPPPQPQPHPDAHAEVQLPSIPPPPSLKTSYDALPSSGTSQVHFDLGNDVILSLNEQEPPTTQTIEYTSNPSKQQDEQRNPFPDFPMATKQPSATQHSYVSSPQFDQSPSIDNGYGYNNVQAHAAPIAGYGGW